MMEGAGVNGMAPRGINSSCGVIMEAGVALAVKEL